MFWGSLLQLSRECWVLLVAALSLMLWFAPIKRERGTQAARGRQSWGEIAALNKRGDGCLTLLTTPHSVCLPISQCLQLPAENSEKVLFSWPKVISEVTDTMRFQGQVLPSSPTTPSERGRHKKVLPLKAIFSVLNMSTCRWLCWSITENPGKIIWLWLF